MSENMEKSIKVGELEIPSNYWSLKDDNKKEICFTITDAILTILDKQISPELDRIVILLNLLDSSIETNEMEENYEVCQVLLDIKTLLNE